METPAPAAIRERAEAYNNRGKSTALKELSQAALLYPGFGWRVFPCEPRGKTTLARLAPNAVHSATTDRETVTRWWRQEPRANIGLACGPAFWCLDLDPDKGAIEALAELEAHHGPLPATVAAFTGSGGRHYYFAPNDRPLNWANRLGTRLDTRNSGGYVVGPPSIHPSGRRYRWLEGRAPGEVPIAEAPRWLLDLLDPPRPEPQPVPFVPAPGGPGASRYAEAALTRELERVALAANGERNTVLNRAAFSLGQLVADGLLAPGPVAAALGGAALATGLNRREIEKTLRSGLMAGMANPRGRLP
jgi:putative DNA primase/helicase